MAEVFEIIERIQYIAEDQGLREAGIEIQKNSDALIDLAVKKERVQRQLDAADKKDIANQKKLHTELKQINEEIKTKSKLINDQAINNRKLNDEIKKEIGLLDNLRRRLDAIQTAKGFATTEKELIKLNKQLAQTQRELDKLDGKGKSSGGSLFQTLLTGVGVGGGMELFQRGLGAINGLIRDSTDEFKDAEKSYLSLQRALKSTGNLQEIDGLVQDANKFSEIFKTVDNDDIIKAQTQLINYGKITRAELTKLTPVILELAAAERIDLTQATETIINILEGRGGATLRQYGVSVKGVKDEHDRLNIVLGQFYDKIKGSSAVFEQTLEGQQAMLEKNLKNVEERFGKTFARVKLKVLPILSDILDGMNYLFETAEEKTQRFAGQIRDQVAGDIKSKSDKQLNELKKSIEAQAVKVKVAIQKAQDDIASVESKGFFSFLEKGTYDKAQSDLAAAKRLKLVLDNTYGAINTEIYNRSTPANNNQFNASSIDSVENPATNNRVTNNKATNKIILDEERASAREIVENREARDFELSELDKSLDKALRDAVKKRNDAELEAEQKAAKERLDARRRGDQEYADLVRENIEAMDRMADDSTKSQLDKIGQIVSDYSQTVGQLGDTIFGFISDNIQHKIDKLSTTLDVAQGQLINAEKIADRGNADLYEKQKERVQSLEAEREKARNNELEYTRIQNALNSALAFTQALLVVTNAGATGDPYSIAERIAAAVAALGAAYSFAQTFKQAKHGLDDSREGEKGSDRLSLPSPNGEDYFGKLYHLANGEAVIQNWDGTADKYRATIKAMRRGTLPEWINDLAMGKPLPLINNKAIQDAVLVIKQESNGDMKAMQEMMKDLVFMIGNMELHSTVLSDNGMFNNYRSKLANLNRRKKA